jgi:HPt (histidine-containing phosphotransfer) domain-containing protein
MTEIPIIAMTAHAMEGDIEQSVIAGMNHHLTKPIEPEILYQTLAYYLSNDQESSHVIQKNTLKDHQVDELKDKQKLKNLTSLNVDKAIQQVQGKLTLYLQLVADFCNQHQQLAPTMEALYENGALEELHRCAHSLKSSAQYIGASNLSDSASQLENEIKIRGKKVASKLTIVTKEIELTISQLNKVYEISVPLEVTEQFNLDAATALFTELKPLLLSGDILAEDLSLQLKKNINQNQTL